MLYHFDQVILTNNVIYGECMFFFTGVEEWERAWRLRSVIQVLYTYVTNPQ